MRTAIMLAIALAAARFGATASRRAGDDYDHPRDHAGVLLFLLWASRLTSCLTARVDSCHSRIAESCRTDRSAI
jgi:hypothetical protein